MTEPDDLLDRRAVATLADCAWTAVPLLVGWTLIGPTALIPLYVALRFVHPALAFAMFGRTLGMAHVGLRLQTADGSPLTPLRATSCSLIRSFEQSLLPVVLPLAALLVTGPERRQRLADVLTGTRVTDDATHFEPVLDGPLPDAALLPRFGAAIVDLTVAWFLARFLKHVLHVEPLLAVGLVLLVLPTLQELVAGRTLGKELAGLRIVMADGGDVTASAIITRNALRIVDLIPITYAVAAFSMLVTGAEQRQRLGDAAAGTLVVPDGSRPARPLPPLAAFTLMLVPILLGAALFAAFG